MNIRKNNTRICCIFLFIAIFVLVLGGAMAEANVKQTKLYKKVFQVTKLKCLACHVDKIPKKGDGNHDWNSYGLKIMATDDVVTEETYKKVGSIEDFEAENENIDQNIKK